MIVIFKAFQKMFKPPNLWSAAKRGDIEAIQRLVTAGANVNEKRDGWTPLHVAVDTGQVDAIKELVRLGAEIDSRDGDGVTPLMMAKTSEQTRVLLELGANINKHSKHGSTALEYAAFDGDDERVKVLLSKGADPNLPRGKHFWRGALVAAVDSKNVNVLKTLLQAGAVVNPEPGKQSALALASLWGRLDMVRLLLAAGADPNHREDGNYTPLMSSVRSKNAEIVSTLLEAGAEVNAKGADNTTALDHACETKRAEIIQMLERAGGKRGREIPKSESKAPPDQCVEFWELRDGSQLDACIEPWPIREGKATLRVQISSESELAERWNIEYRIRSEGQANKEWLPMFPIAKTDGPVDKESEATINLAPGIWFIEFRVLESMSQTPDVLGEWRIAVS